MSKKYHPMTNYDHVVSTRQHPKSIHTPKTTKNNQNNQKLPKMTKNDQNTKKDQKYHPMTSDVIDDSQHKGLPRVPSPNAGQYFKKSGQIGRVSFERQRGIRPGPGPRPGGWAGPGAAPGAHTWRRAGPRPAPGPGPARPAPHLGIF